MEIALFNVDSNRYLSTALTEALFAPGKTYACSLTSTNGHLPLTATLFRPSSRRSINVRLFNPPYIGHLSKTETEGTMGPKSLK